MTKGAKLKDTAQVKIIKLFLKRPAPLALHEIPPAYEQEFGGYMGVSQNSLGTRAPEMARTGYIWQGRRYWLASRRQENGVKAWFMARIEELPAPAPENAPRGNVGARRGVRIEQLEMKL